MHDDQLKFLFVALMVAMAFWGRGDRNDLEKTALQENIKTTSLAAQVQPVFIHTKSFLLKPSSIGQSGSLVDAPIKETVPYRKDWNIADPELKVKAAAVRDLDYGSDFYSSNADVRWPLASLTKLMSAVIATEDIGLEKRVVISESAIAAEGISGNLEVGEQYSAGDLVKAMLVVSSNDAATAVGEFYGLDNFVKKMRDKAVELRMDQTVFADPTGISYLNQGSIEDLEKLVKYIDKNHPEIFKITTNQKVDLRELTKGISKELLNINGFASSRPDFIGGKTGFTNEANGNLISLFNYQGHRILIIVLGTDDRFGQTDILYNWVKEEYEFN
ncbi:MAG: D-alanyl-D-alanine carboxypeptidase [Candidatus Harrisonbacteria bacterium]|nr:D-alanyl-D-alanine carboxypeptidase [Candidatus Harrisonbacteria bacterium]